VHERARQTLRGADVVVLVHDCTDPRPPPQLDANIDLVVHTKLDLIDGPFNGFAVSAKNGANLDALRDRLDAIAFGDTTPTAAALALNARHVEAVTDARSALRRALETLDTSGPELVALELRESLDALGRILGAVTPDDVIGRIFATFCIGK
jgi:tRNA modification GTPase